MQPGDHVQVLIKYDDGWALGLNLSAGHPPPKGVFPFDCLGDIVSASPASPAPAPAGAPPALALPQALQVGGAVNPANIPLPPPTPTGLEPISETEHEPAAPAALAQSQPVVSASPPQLAPLSLDRNDSPLSASFPPAVQALPAPVPTAAAVAQSSLRAESPAPQLKPQQTKRASSLIASRDADLFVALGEVLERKEEGAAAQQKKNEDESLI